MKNCGWQIHDLIGLDHARRKRQAVIVPRIFWLNRPRPAAWVINLNGMVLLSAFESGMFVFTGAKRRRGDDPLVKAVRRTRAKGKQ